MSRRARGSKTDTKSVEESSKSLPACDEANSDENAPSTSQGQSQMQQPGAEPDVGRSDPIPPHRRPVTPITELNGPLMRIKRELYEITQSPPPNCSAEIYKDDLYHWRGTILGPSGTVYEGGVFKLDIRFSYAYPFRPPQVRFITRIYHCNVDSRGVICLDGLNERWSPVMNISKVLLSIWVLIGECNPNDPLVICIAEQYKCNRAEHDRVARYWTKRFATPKSQDGSKEEGLEREQEQSLQPTSSQVLVQQVERELEPAPGSDSSSCKPQSQPNLGPQ